MKTGTTKLNLSPSIWQTLYKIDDLLGRSFPWTERLEIINGILIDVLEIDAIWLFTNKPLPISACGSMRTPLAIAPKACVNIVDSAPPIAKEWSTVDNPLGQAIASKKPSFITANGTSPNLADADLGDVFFDAFNAFPSAIIPLVVEDKSLGALIVGSYSLESLPLPLETQHLLTYLGEHIAHHLQNAHQVEQARHQANVLETLNLIAQTITSSLDIDEVIQRTMTGINQLLEVEAGSLLLVDQDRQDIYFKITLRGENRQISSLRLQFGEGVAGWVVAHNQPALSNSPFTDKRFTPKIDQAIGFTTKNLLCVPLVVHGQPIGALEILNKRSGAFNQADQELLISMAASLGVALTNANLYKDVQEQARQNKLISQITTAINAGHGLSEMGKFIFEQLGQVISFDHISISLLDDTKKNLQQWVLTEHGGFAYSKALISLEGSALAHAIEQNQPQIWDDIELHLGGQVPYPDHRILLEDNISAMVMFPLATRKKPYGSLNLGRRQAKAYGPAEIRLLEQLIAQIAVAIEKSRVIDAMAKQNTELKRLNHLSEMLVSTKDISLIIDTALSMIPRLLPGDVQGVVIAGEEGAYLGVAVPFDFPHTDQIIETIKNTFSEINEDDNPVELVYTKSLAGNMPVPPNWHAETILHLPIITRLGTLGLIYTASGQHETMSDELWQTFSLIASQISGAVENSRLFRQVEQERARLASILASSTDAVLFVNLDGRVILDNPAAWQVMGVEETQRGKHLAEIGDNKILVQLFESAMQGGKPTGEIPLSDGRTFFANISPVSAKGIGQIGSVATMQDVSHFKELNQLKTDFVNSVSHDLRSPLSGILIAAHLMPQVGEVNQAQTELLNTMESRVGSMSTLIDDLLDVSKIEAGIDMEMDASPFVPVVDEVATSLIPQAQNKSIEIECQFPPHSSTVLVNHIRIRQVIYNLIGNAIKYTPEGGKVTVNVFEQGKEVYLQVTDTGIGIPATDQPHIFEKFYRVRGDHVKEIKGTGLGLAITHGIVEKHNGRIWLESVFGEGSTFTVALPLHSAASNPTLS